MKFAEKIAYNKNSYNFIVIRNISTLKNLIFVLENQLFRPNRNARIQFMPLAVLTCDAKKAKLIKINSFGTMISIICFVSINYFKDLLLITRKTSSPNNRNSFIVVFSLPAEHPVASKVLNQ